jgi:hypothetical protein
LKWEQRGVSQPAAVPTKMRQALWKMARRNPSKWRSATRENDLITEGILQTSEDVATKKFENDDARKKTDRTGGTASGSIRGP